MKQKHISVFAHTIFTFLLLPDFLLYRLFLRHTFRSSDEDVPLTTSGSRFPANLSTVVSKLLDGCRRGLSQICQCDSPKPEVQRGEVRTPWCPWSLGEAADDAPFGIFDQPRPTAAVVCTVTPS